MNFTNEIIEKYNESLQATLDYYNLNKTSCFKRNGILIISVYDILSRDIFTSAVYTRLVNKSRKNTLSDKEFWEKTLYLIIINYPYLKPFVTIQLNLLYNVLEVTTETLYEINTIYHIIMIGKTKKNI